ncbi:MAG TPA: hypothetical protein VFM31_01615, partial [Nitrososphaeraceae archaeon]|nr:hypothetical protein [Nitrososphaeraceae archaeon]
MKRPSLLVIISLISFLSIVLITGTPFKSYTNSFDHKNSILLEIPSIQAQDDGKEFGNDDGGNDGGDNDFAGFEEENDGNDDGGNDGGDNDFAGFEEENDDVNNQKENEEDAGQFSFETGNDDQESQQEDIEDQKTEVDNNPFTFVAENPDQDTRDGEETEDVAVQEEDQG